LIKIASLIEVVFFLGLEFKLADNGDIRIIWMNLVIFEIPTENPRYFKSNENKILFNALNDLACFTRT